ncbi:MAG: phosphopantetheine-binding protein [Myxococcota bacterium]
MRLDVSHPFHSPLVAPAVDALAEDAARLVARRPAVPLVSSVTGAVADALGAAHWLEQVCAPVRFADAVAAMAGLSVEVWVEVSARPVLLPALGQGPDALALPALRAGRPEPEALLDAVGAWFARGGALDGAALFPEGGARTVLPAYPWARRASAPSEAPAAASDEVLDTLRAFVAKQLRRDVGEIDVDRPLLELGADSIVFVETGHLVERTWGLQLALHQLFDEVATLRALAAHVTAHRPARVPEPVPVPELARPSEPAAVPSTVRDLVEAQLRIMAQQLDVLRGTDPAPRAAPPPRRPRRPPPPPSTSAAPSPPPSAPTSTR